MSETQIVGRYPVLALAQLAQAALAAEGIAGFFENAEIVNADWMLGNAVGDVKLLVATQDAEAACTILNAMQTQRREREAEVAETGYAEERCLACGATLSQDVSECSQCGWTFTDSGDDLSPDVEHSEDATDGPENQFTDQESNVLENIRENITVPSLKIWLVVILFTFGLFFMLALLSLLTLIGF